MALTINGTTGIETNTDTGKLKVGASDDLEISHDSGSTESRVWHTNTSGWLNLRGDAIKIGSYTGTEDQIITSQGGAVKLFHSNVQKFETTASGAKVTGPGTTNGVTLELNDAASGNDSRHLNLLRGSTNAYIGIAGSQSNDPLFLSRTGNRDVLIDSSGNVEIDDGNLIIGTAGHGIDFSAQTQSTSTTDDELLNHYEKGKWTPVLKKNGGANGTPSNVGGRYVRVGNMVWLSCYMYWSSGSNAEGASGDWTLHGLPFTLQSSESGCYIYQNAPIGYFVIDNVAYSYDHGNLRWQYNSDTYFDLYTSISSSDLAWTTSSMQMSMTGTFLLGTE